MTADPPRDPMSAGVHLDRAAAYLAGLEAGLEGDPLDTAELLAIVHAHAAIAQARYTGTIARRTGS